MNADWQKTELLSDDQRLAVLNHLLQLDQALGREAIDENRRRAVLHRQIGEYWLQEASDGVTAFATVENGATASVEMAGGGYDPALSRLLTQTHQALQWWYRSDGPIPSGTRSVRSLHYMRCEPIQLSTTEPELPIRSFRPGVDDERWVEQNNASFRDHPEQGAWTLKNLRQRLAEPWFDPSGFLIHEVDGALAASCWTKVHESTENRVGEIYVISVHPRFQGQGLGRQMLLAGLRSFVARGIGSASLYVDSSNVSAISMYQSAGFSLVRTDHVLERTA